MRRTVLLAALLLALSTRAATFTVTDSGDSGPGTLRQAILDANATPALDHIVFATGGVQLFDELPPITSPVFIDGTIGSNSRAAITGPSFDGADVFTLQGNASGSTLRDMRIVAMENAIRVVAPLANVTVANNEFRGNLSMSGSHHLIGGMAAGEGNQMPSAGPFRRALFVGDGHQVYRNSFPQILTNATGITIGRPGAGNSIGRLFILNGGALIEGNAFGFISVDDITPPSSPVTITGNTFAGAEHAVIVANAASRVAILGNSMTTTGIPIDLGGDGPTANDRAPDADTGANDLQNHPVLASAILTPARLTVSGTIDSVPLTTFRIELFGNPADDPDAHAFLGFVNVTTDAAGHASLHTATSPLPSPADVVTSTATNLTTSNTSEVSAPAAIALPGAFDFAPASSTVDETEGTVTLTVVRNGGSEGTATVDFATADGTATAPGDYEATAGTLTFGDGVTSQTIVVPIVSDAVPEGAETFTVVLSNPGGGATIGAGTATVTIASHLPVEAVPAASAWALLALAVSLAVLAAGVLRGW